MMSIRIRHKRTRRVTALRTLSLLVFLPLLLVVTVPSQAAAAAKPHANCQDVTVDAPTGTCEADVDTSLINDGSTDPDGTIVSQEVDPPGPYPVGETIVKYTVTDNDGDTASCHSTITVNDVDPPVISGCPTGFSVSTDPGQCTAVVNYATPTALDLCDGALTVNCDFPSGFAFPKGVTAVHCTVTDASGNPAAPCNFNVTVTDNEPPVISGCPNDTSVSADAGQCTAVVNYTVPTALDNCDGPLTVNCDFPSGFAFPVGITTVTCTVSDAAGNPATPCIFDVTVSDNEAPVISGCPSDMSVGTDPGQCTAVVNYPVPTASDDCDGPLTVNCDHPSGFAFPKGTTTVTCTVSDAAGNPATPCIFDVTVNDTEDPVANCPGDFSVFVDHGAYTASPTINSFITDNCPGGNINCTPGGPYDIGSRIITCTATDAAGRTDQCTFQLTVNNHAPVATGESYEVQGGSQKIVPADSGVLINDTDQDGHTLSAIRTVDVVNGTLALDGNGSFTYTPNPGFEGQDRFKYVANDNVDNSNEVQVDLLVGPIEIAPEANPDGPYTANKNKILSVNPTNGVLANDTDLNGDVLTAVRDSDGSHGHAILATDGSFTYEPNDGYSGSDSFTYHANDGGLNSDPATVTINVVNHAPVANPDSFWVNKNETLNEPAATGVLDNDSDEDGDALTVGNPRPANNVDHGSLTLNSDGSFTYTPTPGYQGVDDFTYFAFDGETNSSTAAKVTITITGGTPHAENDSYSTDQNQPLVISAPGVLTNDTDPDNDPLTVGTPRPVSNPSHGVLSALNQNGSFTYTPTTGYHGDDHFTYLATDGNSNSNVATVTITVTCPCDTPTASTMSIATTLNQEITDTLTASVPCEGPTFSIVAQPPSSQGHVSGLPNATGDFTFEPANNFAGNTSFTYRVTDQCGQPSPAATVSVRVQKISAPAVQLGTRNADCGENGGDPQLAGASNLVITNSDGGTMRIIDLKIESDPNSEFSIDKSGLSVTLEKNQSASFPVSYCPVDGGADAANVRISFDALSASAQTDLLLEGILTGEGAAASCTVVSSYLFDGNTQSGNQSTALLPVTNTSSVIVRLDGASTGQDTLFEVATTLPHYIMPSDPDPTGVEIRFLPKNIVRDTFVQDILTLSSNAGDKQVTLNAQAVPETWFPTEQANIVTTDNCHCDSAQFRLQNRTGLPLNVLALTPRKSSFTITGFTPGTQVIGNGFAGPYMLTYCPDGDTGTVAAEIQIRYKDATDPQAPEQSVNVPIGSGKAAAPLYSRTPSSPISKTVGVNEAATYTIVVKNSGGADLTIDCSSMSAPFSDPVCPGTVAAGGGPQNIVIQGQSSQVGTFTGTLSLTTNGYSGNCSAPVEDEIVLKLTVEDRQAPEFLDATPGVLDSDPVKFATMGQQDVLRGRIYDETAVTRVYLRLRRPNGVETDTAYSAQLNAGNLVKIDEGWQFEFVIPNTYTNSAGYQYLLTATDGTHTVALDWVSREIHFAAGVVKRPNDNNHGTIKLDGRWYMIGAPAVLTNASPDSVLKAGANLSASENDWKLYPAHKDGDTTSSLSRSQPVFEPGKAVWFRHVAQSGDPALVWSLPAGTTSPLAGKSDDTFTISLLPGPWTMFSNPFPFDVYVPVDAGFLVSGTSAFLRGRPTGYSNENSGETITSADDTHMEYRQDGTGQRYAIIRPWVGYAIRRSTLNTLPLVTHPESDPNTWSTVTPAPSKGPGITMSLRSGTRLVGEIICGLGDDARDGWDWTDRPLFPLPRAAGTFYIKHDDWGDYSDRYVIDRRAASASGSAYTLGWHLPKTGNSEMRLTVESIDPLPAGQSAVLYDRATGSATELRAGTVYAFRSELQRDDQRFAVLVGDQGFTQQWAASEESNRPTDFRLAPNYPNPFNAGTVIEFQLTEYSDVQLAVFNILGQRVRTLIDRPMYPGTQSVQFDGRDDHNQSLPTGVYFYRLTTNQGSISKKMVLLK